MEIKIFVNEGSGKLQLPEGQTFADGSIEFMSSRFAVADGSNPCKIKSGSTELAEAAMCTLLKYKAASPTVGPVLFKALVTKLSDDTLPAIGDKILLGEGEYSLSSSVDADDYTGVSYMPKNGKLLTFIK